MIEQLEICFTTVVKKRPSHCEIQTVWCISEVKVLENKKYKFFKRQNKYEDLKKFSVIYFFILKISLYLFSTHFCTAHWFYN